MLQKIKIKIEGIRSQNDKVLIETEIDVLGGVKNADVDEKTGETSIEFDDLLISEDKILDKIENLGYKSEGVAGSGPSLRERLYFVKGMHCASCEVLIEKRLLAIKGIKSAEAKLSKGEVLIEYMGNRPKVGLLNSIFRKENYVFFDQPPETESTFKKNNFFTTAIISLLVIAAFLYINKSGLAGLVNVSSKSSLPTFFVLGLIAGISSCAALVGGMVLSMSKQWLEIYSGRKSTLEKLQPHLMFNIGRIISYAVFGAILGVIGSRLQVSFKITSFLIIAVSILMFLLSLQMLGVKSLRRFQFTLPKSVTRYIADETKFKGRYMPALMGALTFFLPCGFTITSQGMALLSGNPIQGGLIMGFFALGTAPALLLIGLSSIKFSSRPHLAFQFSRVAGVVILFFALFNVNNQLNVLGFSSISDFLLKSGPVVKNTNPSDEGIAPTVDGKQILKMDAYSSGYKPNYFKVRAGVPVRWEINDIGTSGCTNAVLSRGLFDGQIALTPGKISVKEFTPQKPGKYKFSCWMGMISGIIEVVEGNSSSVNLPNNNFAAAADNEAVIPSGAKGCGCGGGGGSGCSIR